jgi:hypothetical protein
MLEEIMFWTFVFLMFFFQVLVIQIVVAVVISKITTTNNVDTAQKANDGVETKCLHGRECVSLLLPLRVHKKIPLHCSA